MCAEPVRRDQMELALEFRRGACPPVVDLFHFHLRCFAAWEFERTKV